MPIQCAPKTKIRPKYPMVIYGVMISKIEFLFKARIIKISAKKPIAAKNNNRR